MKKTTLTAIVAAGALTAIAPQAAPAQDVELPVTDLSVNLIDAPDPAPLDGQLTYTITARNIGFFDAPNTIVQDRLADSVELVSTTPTGSCNLVARVVSCDLGTLVNGELANVTIVVDVPAAGRVPNSASVAADVIELNTSNNRDKEGTAVVPPCDGEDVTIAGTNANNTITGTPNRDVISTFSGNDTIDGGGDKDVICGGDGADKLRGKGGDDRLLGEAGKDTLRGGAADDSLDGGAGLDFCRGGPGSNTLTNCEQ